MPVRDEVEIVIEEDAGPRVVEIPRDLKAALEANPNAQALFLKLSYTHQKEYVDWILDAKRPETRQRRVASTIEMLEQGKRER